MASSDEIDRKKRRDREVHARIKNMSKEAKAAALSRKKECNARAMSIVEYMIEPNVQHLWLLENLKHINQSHFQDIVEERAITRCCGYPLCDRELTNVPKKMYKISTKVNKVYDITDRKNYCSNICYKAGTYLKDQMYTTPLWLRECEIPVEFKILSGSIESKGTGVGAEIDLGNTCPVKLDNISNMEENTIEESSISENPENNNTLKHKSPQSKGILCNKLVTQKNPKEEKSFNPKTDKKGCNDSNSISCDCSELNNMNASKNSEKFREKISTHSFTGIEIEHNLKLKRKSGDKSPIKNSDCDISSKLKSNESEYNLGQTNVNKSISKEKCSTKNSESPLNCVVSEIEERVVSWFTLESMVYILGQEQLRALLDLSGFKEVIPVPRSSKKEEYEIYLKNQEIYKKLNTLELKERHKKQRPYNSIPDYKKLSTEAGDFELKVHTFYQEGPKVNIVPTKKINETPKHSTGNVDVPALPLVNHYAILATRHKIFLDKLDKILPDMLSALELSQFRCGLKMAELVATFNLEAKNFSFRPAEWDLVAVILIKLLTINNPIFKLAFTRELTQRRLMAYLLIYNLDGGYLDRFTAYLVDIDRIFNKIQTK